MRLAVISSGAGGVFRAFEEILARTGRRVEYTIVTDRACDIGRYAAQRGINHAQIDWSDNISFSKAALQHIDEFGGVEFILLLFTRLVTTELFERYLTFNLHPSLLPAFKGFHALEKTLESGVKFFGTTLHLVNQHADSGKIIAQASAPIRDGFDLELLNRASFLQKTYLASLLTELFEAGRIKGTPLSFSINLNGLHADDQFNPVIQDASLLSELRNLAKKNHLDGFIQ